MDKICLVCQREMKCLKTGLIVVDQRHYSSGDLFGCTDCGHTMIFGINPRFIPVNPDVKFDCRLDSIEIDWATFADVQNGWLVICDFKGKFSLCFKDFMERWNPTFSTEGWEWLS